MGKKEVQPNMRAVDQVINTFDRCENCECRLKHYHYGKGKSRWCARCIKVWERKQNLDAHRAERVISMLVGPLYMEAGISDLPEAVRVQLSDLKHGRDVFFFGPIGTGKTHAMAALIREYIYGGYECIRINFDDFCVQVRSTMSPVAKETEWDLIEPLKEVDKLFIDDLGLRSKGETDFAYVTLYSILNKRQERMLPTFISSNKDISRLTEAFDSRIASRLGTALQIEMTGDDRRQQKKAR